MAVTDLWVGRDRKPTARHGRGMRWRVSVAGYPSTSHRTKAEADRVHAERTLAGPPTPETEVTVGDCLAVWLAGKKGLRPRSYTACLGAARIVRPHWQDVRVVAVDQHAIAEWLGALEGRDGLASASLRRQVLQALGGALAVAQDRGLVSTNAARKVRVRASQRREPHFLSGDELVRLAKAARDPGAILLLGTSGLRIGEACALNVGDVVKRKGRTRLRVRTSKSGRARDVPISPAVLRLLNLTRPAGEPLLTSATGSRLDVRNFRGRDLAVACEAAGISDFRPHDLRHTAASLAIAAGADVKAVQQMLGHASATVTLDIYSHLFDSHIDDVADRIGGLLRI